MRRTLMLLCLCLMLGGCSALPAEDRSYAVALGVSRTDGMWQASARVPGYQQNGKYLTLTGEGETLQDALRQLNASAPMRVYCGQLRLLVFHRDAAAMAEFPQVVEQLGAMPDMRLQAQLCVTEDEVEKLMDALNPETGTRLSKSLDLMLETRRKMGTIPDASLSAWMRAGQRQNPVLIAAAVEESEDKQGDQPSAKAVLSGGYLTDENGRIGALLSSENMQLLSLLQGSIKRASLTVDGMTVTVGDVRSKIRLDGNVVRCSLRLHCTSAQQQEPFIPALETALRALTRKLMDNGCDALGLGGQAIRHFHDQRAWTLLDWPQVYRTLLWEFEMDMQPPVRGCFFVNEKLLRVFVCASDGICAIMIAEV